MMDGFTAWRVRGGAWKVARATAAPSHAHAASLADAGRAGREGLWLLGQGLARDASPWDIEYHKAVIGTPEFALGFARLLAQRCAQAGDEECAAIAVPVQHANLRTARRELARCNLARASRLEAWGDRLRFAAAAGAALAGVLVHAATRREEQPPPASDSKLAFALHGEWGTRTRHLLQALAVLPVACIVVIGRLKRPLAAVAAEWQAQGVRPPPLVHPFSLGATLHALPRMAALLAQGWTHAPQRLYLPPAREHMALAFRVLLGAAMREWWRTRGPAMQDVLFGHTGTADTVQLEAAMQERGARTTHVVHGLAVGANFAAFSDVALFRCGFDADRYGELGGYRRCEVQEAAMPHPARGADGLYLLTNLAHPMNPGYSLDGAQDELRLLRLVAEVSRLLRPAGQRMVWRPHPAIRLLPAQVARTVRAEAQRLGFEEQEPTASILETARGMRWVVTSPSTTAVELLASGTLCTIVDLQQSAVGTAPQCFPGCAGPAAAVADVLRTLDDESSYAEHFRRTWQTVRPGRPLEAAAIQALAAS